MIFGTKKVSRNSGITNFETLFSAKSQIGSKNFLKSTFLANFHETSIFENHNTIIRFILTCLLSYLLRSLINNLKKMKILNQFQHEFEPIVTCIERKKSWLVASFHQLKN